MGCRPKLNLVCVMLLLRVTRIFNFMAQRYEYFPSGTETCFSTLFVLFLYEIGGFASFLKLQEIWE
jgi:hypothetical protein